MSVSGKPGTGIVFTWFTKQRALKKPVAISQHFTLQFIIGDILYLNSSYLSLSLIIVYFSSMSHHPIFSHSGDKSSAKVI